VHKRECSCVCTLERHIGTEERGEREGERDRDKESGSYKERGRGTY
jgi:hypothetical protein